LFFELRGHRDLHGKLGSVPRKFLKIPLLLALCSLSGIAAAAAAESKNPSRPNIVLILSDDHGWADVGWHSSEIKTPHLDRLAMAGARLEQFYAQPVCSPTRAALMTGRYPMRYGLQVDVIRPWARYGLPLEERTLPQALRESGYTTALCGKWHLGHFEPSHLPTHRGFDRQYGHYTGEIDYFTHTRAGGFDWHRDDKVCRDEGYSTFLIAQEAVRLIQAQPADRPLFLYVPFNAVHTPNQVPARYKEPYGNLPEPRRTYAGMVAAEDEAVGQIVAAIDTTGRRANTLFIWCSDNGGPSPGRITSNGSFRAGKGTLYEGGVRVCGMMAWEGHIRPGTVVEAPLHIVDLFPTLLKLAGASLDQKLPLDGRDAWPAIARGEPSPHDAILLNTTPHSGALRMGDWKLVLNGNRPTSDDEAGLPPAKGRSNAPRAEPPALVELFNLAKDPYEKTNVANDQTAMVAEMRARYDALARQAIPPKNHAPAPGYKSPVVWGEEL
jgi:arylsulfatase A-like enzyme